MMIERTRLTADKPDSEVINTTCFQDREAFEVRGEGGETNGT